MAKKKKKDSWVKRHTLGILIAVLAVIVVMGYGVWYCLRPYQGDTAWVYIPSGATDESVRDSLRSSLGNGEGTRIWAQWHLAGGKPSVAHGAYLIQAGTAGIDVARTLKRGTQTPVKISFPSVRTVENMAQRLTSTLECDNDDFLRAADSILIARGYKKEEFPALFLPDTYEVYWTSSGESLINRLLDYYDKFWNSDRKAKAKALGLTPIQVATLASIVEEESAKADEYSTIARLYLNRLQRNMLLQADPTVKFATGDFTLRRILNSHLSTPSPYNTYLHAGLPPGPIRIPAPTTIDAVLNAPSHPYLYMCAKEDFSGRHNFAVDYATHMANARRYHQALSSRNIR